MWCKNTSFILLPCYVLPPEKENIYRINDRRRGTNYQLMISVPVHRHLCSLLMCLSSVYDRHLSVSLLASL